MQAWANLKGTLISTWFKWQVCIWLEIVYCIICFSVHVCLYMCVCGWVCVKYIENENQKPRANDDLNEALRLHCVCDLQITIYSILLLLFTHFQRRAMDLACTHKLLIQNANNKKDTYTHTKLKHTLSKSFLLVVVVVAIAALRLLLNTRNLLVWILWMQIVFYVYKIENTSTGFSIHFC